MSDISKPCRQLARLVDRLPPGRHTIELTKRRSEPWLIEVRGDEVNYQAQTDAEVVDSNDADGVD